MEHPTACFLIKKSLKKDRINGGSWDGQWKKRKRENPLLMTLQNTDIKQIQESTQGIVYFPESIETEKLDGGMNRRQKKLQTWSRLQEWQTTGTYTETCKTESAWEHWWDGRKRLAPETSIISMKPRTQRSSSHKQLGARVIIAMCVDRVGEGADIREVASPRLIMVLRQKEHHRQDNNFNNPVLFNISTVCIMLQY